MIAQRPTTILIVDGDVAPREALKRALADSDYAVLVASSGEEAIDILFRYKERIDWLFTDVRLPGAVDGWRVAEEFRFAHPFRPVVYATAYALDAPRMVPGSIFFQKPYRASEIVAAFEGLRDTRGGEALFPPPRAWPSLSESAAEQQRGRSGYLNSRVQKSVKPVEDGNGPLTIRRFIDGAELPAPVPGGGRGHA